MIAKIDGQWHDVRARHAVPMAKRPANRPMRWDTSWPIKKIEKRLRRILRLERICDDTLPGCDWKLRELTFTEAFPRWRWLACYAVTGDSEGWYVHVDVISGDSRKLLFLCKTFADMDAAYKIAKRCAELLGA